MESVNISEIKGRLSEYLSRASAGERFVIFRRERPLAALVSVAELERLERSSRMAQKLALALGQDSALLKEVEAGEAHPVMAAFGLWADEGDLNDLASRIIENRLNQLVRDVGL